MSLLAIEINDAAITVADASGVVHHSPGFALLQGERPRLGQAAARQALIYPTQTNSRFWEALETRRLSGPGSTAWSCADLVYWHLESIWQQVGEGVRGVILALPGDYSRSQLGTLLGIFKALAIPVRAMADSALVASEPDEAAETLVHLDAQLHRVVLTRLDRTQDWQRSRVEVLPNLGLIHLRQRCVQAIARHFVQQSRFDPLHSAASEQALYDQLPGLFAELSVQDTAPVVLDSTGQSFSVLMARDELAKVLAESYGQIIAAAASLQQGGGRFDLQVGSQLAALPGLLPRFSDALQARAKVLPSGAGALGALKRRHRLIQDSDRVRYTARLVDPGRAVTGDESEPTHLLYRGQAFAVGAAGLTLGSSPGEDSPGLRLEPVAGVTGRHCRLMRSAGVLRLETLGDGETWVNGQPVTTDQALRVGDRLRLGGSPDELLLIRLAEQ